MLYLCHLFPLTLVIGQRFLVIWLSVVECANIYIIHHYESTHERTHQQRQCFMQAVG